MNPFLSRNRLRAFPGVLCCLIVCSLPLTATAQARDAANLARAIDSLLAAPAAAQAHWGISVTTLDGRLIYEKNDGQLFAPASNAKLFTTAAALALLGPNATIVTRVVAAAAPDASGNVTGDVTLMGAGDASMSGRAYPYSGRTDRPNPPLGALESLADQLQQRGVRRVIGNIVGDDTAFPWEPYDTGWAWDDQEWSWGGPISALTVNDNAVYLTVTPGPQPGDPLTVAWNPEIAGAYFTVDNQARTSVAGSQPSLGLDRPLGTRAIRIFGTLPANGSGKDSAKHLALAIPDPAEFAAMAFRQMLITRGIAVSGGGVAHHRLSVDTQIYEQSVMRPLDLPTAAAETSLLQLGTAPPPSAVVLASRTSAPLIQDMTVTNKVSQNLHAEIFLRLLGKQYGEDGSIVEGARTVRAYVLRAGVAPDDFFFYDGSGLSPEDRVAPRAVTTLLRYIAAQPWGAEFRATLPVGGADGTLADRFQHGRLRGRVFAKTGTLEEVNALGGYVTSRSGRTLVFSIICNGHMPEATGITHTIDGIVSAVAAAE